MYWIITKFFITAGIIVFISEVVKRSDKLGSLIASLPTVTILAMIWMFVENTDKSKISNHAYYTFWYVVPTLPMFLIFPYLYNRFSFFASLGICVIVTFVCFILTAVIAKYFGVDLF
ncbi:MAG: DUF3147 family protein [Candidatus Delongbacteria bacterium]|nr:DUF3147 family protein [Candidatus Delongbacteria bacterium]MBN2836363.1 DUF3147 family protein [Candidatus Delongbacteria bacterium]